MPDGGLMKITVERSSQNGLPVQCVTVQDTGEGIPPEAMENLFTPFFTTREKGTGLGLAILKNIVEGHGGKIFIDSPISTNPQGERMGTAVSIFLTANRK